ncbi:MAG TPA: glycoside hydrolase family 16 protein [Candidatus Limnocylindrales bacterium]
MVVGIVNACGGGGAGSDQGGSPSTGASATNPAASNPGAPAPSARSPGPADWKLIWSDEFNAPAGTPPDPGVWSYDLGDGSASGIIGWGNREREYYTNRTANAATDGQGHLLVTVRAADGSETCYYGRCEYTSARLLTKDRYAIQYGRIEARIKVPGGVGLWPVFWMLGTDIGQVGWPNSGEIDVMEFVGRRPNEILGTIHGPGYSGSSGFTKTVDVGRPVADDFHTFAIEWRPDHIVWYLDGKAYFQAGPADVAPNRWVFNHPFFLILNVAVGGNLGGPVGPDTSFPQAMAVDYVRLYQETAQ